MSVVVVLAAGTAGALLGRLVRLPLWPITGAIAGSLTASLLTGTTVVPSAVAISGQLLVGCAVGAVLGRDLFARLRPILAPAAVIIGVLLSVGLVFGVLLALTGVLPPIEAYLGAVPGGVGEMVAATAGLGADSALVAAMHFLRLIVVLALLPLFVRLARRWFPADDG